MKKDYLFFRYTGLLIGYTDAEEPSKVELTEEERDAMRAAVAIARRVRTPTTAAAARENGKKGGRPSGTGKPLSDEARQRMKAAQAARRERERGNTPAKETAE